jgi:predicted ABC-type ATPase
MKEIILIGGPNGAGKTTAAQILLPEFFELHEFLNADEIARSISPQDVESAALFAGRLFIERMRANIRSGRSFALETTCSGKSYIPILKKCRAAGWRISLMYFWLPSPEASIARVARRVSQGGHNIPEDVIRRRYKLGVHNMRTLYLPLAQEAEIYDNTDRNRVLVAEKREDKFLLIRDPERWAKIEEVAP